MKKNKDDREMFFDNQAYFSNPMMSPPFQSSNMMYYTPNMMPYSNMGMGQNPNYYNNYNYDNNIEMRINKLERVVRRLEEKVAKLENKSDINNSTYQTTNNNYSNNDTYMV